jgi:hypothetical protein
MDALWWFIWSSMADKSFREERLIRLHFIYKTNVGCPMSFSKGRDPVEK